MSTRRIAAFAFAFACAATALAIAPSEVSARIDDSAITIIDDVTTVRQFSIAHNPEKNEYFAVWREAEGSTDNSVVGVLLDGEGSVISGPTVIAEERDDSTGDRLSSAGFWNAKVVYNPASDQYLALLQRTGLDVTKPVEDRRNAEVFGQLISDAGTPVGAEVSLNPPHGTFVGCMVRNPDVIVDPATGGYVLTYVKWYGTTTDVGDACDGLTPVQSVTMIQRLTASLARGTSTQFPVINEEGPTSPRIGHNPATGEFLVTQPYTGRFQIADNNNGSTFPIQRYSSTLAPVGAVVKVDTAPIVPGTSSVNEAIPTADPATGNWFITSTSRFFGFAWSNLLSPTGVSLRDGTAIQKGFPTSVAPVGDGTFVFSTQSGTLVQVRPDGTEIHSTTPFANAVLENTTAVDVAGSSGVAIGLAPDAAGIATTTFAVVAPGALPLSPARLLETRDGPDLTTIDGEFEGDGKVAAGRFVALTVAGRGGVPVDADAVLLNIAAAGAPTGGFVTAYPCDADERPTTSNLNYAAGAAASAAAIAKVSASGTVCVFTSAEAHLIVDVNGYVPAAGSVTPIVPARLLETRVGPELTTTDGVAQGINRVAANSTTQLQVTGRGGVASDADAVLVNVTAIKPATPAFLTIFPCGATQPTAANLNSPAGGIVNNLTLARTGDGGKICIFSSAATDLAVDVAAFVPAGGGLLSIVPARLYETRTGLATVDGDQAATGRIGAEREIQISTSTRGGIPDDASGVMLNVAAIKPSSGGYFTLYPCGTERPLAANVNFTSNAVVSNAVFVKLGASQSACLYSSTSSDIAIDAIGYTLDN